MDGNDGFGEDIHVLRRNWAESIRMILDDNGLTLEAFVERVALETDVEIASKTVSRWLKPEEGGGLPEYAKMRAVAVAFGIPVASLLDDRACDGRAAHVPPDDLYALERALVELDFADDGVLDSRGALHDILSSRRFAMLVHRIAAMRAGMPRPAAGKPHTVDEYLRDLDTAAALRAAVREAAELLVAETTPLPPRAGDYLPPDRERDPGPPDNDDSPVPWVYADHW